MRLFGFGAIAFLSAAVSAAETNKATVASIEGSGTVDLDNIQKNKNGLRGMNSRMASSVGQQQQQRRSLEASSSNALSCPSPGFTTALRSYQAGGTVTLASVGTMGHLCTLTKITVEFEEIDLVRINQVSGQAHVDTIIPLARSYDDVNWSNAAGEIPAVMLPNGWDCVTSGTDDYCSAYLPALEKENELYVLTSYEHTLPVRDEVSRFLSQATFGVTPEELDDARWDGGEGGEFAVVSFAQLSLLPLYTYILTQPLN